jgi:6-phosphogluconolactonase
LSEREPDLAISSETHLGVEPSALPAPNAGEPELVVAADPDAVAVAAADRISAALVAAVDRRGRADFCTTGGSTPVPIYRLLARSPLCDSIPWSQIHVWWGDDRFVPRGSPESNVTSLDTALLGGEGGEAGAPLPPANIHPVPVAQALSGLHDRTWCAARYADRMAQILPIGDGNWPVFDLILVGVGDDGHVLSCFPDSPAFRSLAWVMGVPAPTHLEPHLDRVTINPRMLEASPVLVVTSGSRKADALGHVFGEIRDNRRWPVQRTRRTGAVWIVDEAAAVGIPPALRS